MSTECLYVCFIDILGSKQKLMNGPDYSQQKNAILCYEVMQILSIIIPPLKSCVS